MGGSWKDDLESNYHDQMLTPWRDSQGLVVWFSSEWSRSAEFSRKARNSAMFATRPIFFS